MPNNCIVYGTEHKFVFDYAESDKTAYYCICGEQKIEYEDAGTGA